MTTRIAGGLNFRYTDGAKDTASGNHRLARRMVSK
jgi:hypothetical protein